jgi:hypothetical protein
MNKYYLHRRVKKFAIVRARSRTVFVTNNILEKINDREKGYLRDLINLGYNVQYEIE